MSNFLVNAGPAIAAVLGMLAFVWAFIAAADVFLLASGIFFGSAIIAAQIARIPGKKDE